jgi:hypothetical protein
MPVTTRKSAMQSRPKQISGTPGFYDMGRTTPKRQLENTESNPPSSPLHKKSKVATYRGLKNFHLMRLPTELRLEVYKKLLPMSRGGIRIYLSLYRDYFASGTRVRYPDEVSEHSTIVRDGATLLSVLGTLLNLAKASRTTHAEVMPVLCNDLRLCVNDPEDAGWFGSRLPFFASSITSIDLAERPRYRYQSSQDSSPAYGLDHFTKLGVIRCAGVHTHKSALRWGTRYVLDDLRMMKFILDNSRLSQVGVITTEDNVCKRNYRDCSPTIAFVTEATFRKNFEGPTRVVTPTITFGTKAGFRNNIEGTTRAVFSEIDVEVELKKGLSSPIAKGRKRKRRDWALQR